jgi:hypothetical protein
VKNITTWVGIDAHKKDLFVAMLVGDQAAPVAWTVPNEPNAIRRLVRKLERETPGPVRVCYEAGPCGYALQRQMTTTRVSCQVIAPALIPRKPGERIKTNARDARKLAELFRATCSPRSDRRRLRTKRSAIYAAHATMLARICSGVAIGWASFSCERVCTTAGATGPVGGELLNCAANWLRDPPAVCESAISPTQVSHRHQTHGDIEPGDTARRWRWPIYELCRTRHAAVGV